MKYLQVALFCFLCVAKSYGQTGVRSYHTIVVEISKEKKPKRIMTKVDITTAFPGGDSAWVKSIEEQLNKTVKLNKKARAGKYAASVRFLIERDGSVADIACLTDPGFGICEKVRTAILRSTLGRWRPVADSGKKGH